MFPCYDVAMVHTLAAVGPRQVHTQLAARRALSGTALVQVWHTPRLFVVRFVLFVNLLLF